MFDHAATLVAGLRKLLVVKRLKLRSKLGDNGFEYPSFSSGNTDISNHGGAKSGALDEMASQWADLPEPVKATILALVNGWNGKSN